MFASRCPRWRSLFSAQTSPNISPALYISQYTKIIQKKRKSVDAEPDTPSLPAGEPLSPQQLDRISRNKKAALERLASAQTPPGFGESWKRGLSAEFGKPYFKQVRIVTPHEAARLCRVQTLKTWLVFTVDEFCRWREEETHGVPACWARLHLDSDVWRTRCRFRFDGWFPTTLS